MCFELGVLVVWHVSVFTIRLQPWLVREQAVTVSHAYCPCASFSNLSIPLYHALRVLHKMCISRTALSPAHAERTCSVALQNTYHGRISASNSPQPQIPANENAQKREGERGRERTARDTKSEPNPTQTDTTQVERTERRSHFLLTCKRDWCFCLYQWVCVSCLTPLSRICWLYFLRIHEKRLIFRSSNVTRARTKAQYPDRRKHPGIFEETCLS